MKKLLLLLIPFILTGCASVEYNLNINKDLTVNEEVNISATKDYFNIFYMDLPITIVSEAYHNEYINNTLKQNNYNYELRRNNYPYPSVFVSKKYNLLNDYSNNTIFNGQVFENIFVAEDNNNITLKTENFISYAPDDGDGSIHKFSVSDLSINIKIPFKVIHNNADKYDEKTNTYTWIVNEKTKDKVIDITFDKTKIYIYNLTLYISITIFVILIGVLIYIIIRFRRKNLIMNRL